MTWEIAVNIAQIVSALGTVAAVIVALLLAHQAQSQRLQFFSAVFGDTVTGPGSAESYLEYSLSITIVNSGVLPAVIQSASLFFEGPNGGYGWHFGPISGAGHFPLTLEHGQQIRCTAPFKMTDAPWDQIHPKWITARRIKFTVETSLGRKYIHKPNRMMLSAMKARIQAARESSQV